MTCFQRILLPTDFSALAAHATRFAGALAERSGATLHVLHACQPVIVPPAAAEFGLGLETELPDTAALKSELETFVRRVCGDGRFPLVVAVRTGRPVRVIAEYARALDIDLIVIGTHGRSVLWRLLRGSISKSVLERATCAVLLVPPTAAASDDAAHDPEALVAAGRGQGAF